MVFNERVIPIGSLLIWLPWSHTQNVEGTTDLRFVEKRSIFCYLGDNGKFDIMLALDDLSLVKCDINEIGRGPSRGPEGMYLWMPISFVEGG